ncbi:coiled-coil domain-containing protein 120 [Paramormyrops kingsleyae]|uniref:Coiled-coil domain containing 120a n=1 Tax=Paramormyrops kingsleyae TaxID=1676925 RepID=A0A3B3QRH0_9TELE|nr:coiled-coil domain-containing protein 120-like [Paramormyrops kingsleyae]XP_023691635.1 coiled-coil domain-containing protein 120-like [Paramormyrops kingsleyae]
MATGPEQCFPHENSCTVSTQLVDRLRGRAARESHDMEVKGHLITVAGLGAPDPQGCGDSKQHAERVSELQERRRNLQTLLNTRLGELRHVCLLEAELTGQLPSEFPLEAGEKPPQVRRRPGIAPRGHKHSLKGEEEEACQWKQRTARFRGALRRQADSEQPPHGKKTVHRGCHTDEAVKSESSSMSDSTGQDNDDSSPSVGPERLAPGSPDGQLCRKLSPVEIYYEMRTRRNSAASSSRPEVSSGSGSQQWSDSPEGPQVVQLHPQEGLSTGSSERPGCPYSARTRRSNSSDALLDRTTFPDEGVQRPGMPCRGGPYKSSEALTDGRLRQVQRGSPEGHLNGHGEQGRLRSSMGGRGGGSYNEILMDYIWGKQQKMQQRQQPASGARPWTEAPSTSFPAAVAPQLNGFPAPQAPPFAAGPPPYSPLLLRGKPGDPRRVKVTRTKSCGPFVPLQPQHQEALLFSAYSDPPHATPGSAAPYPYPAEQTGAPPARRPLPFPGGTAEESTRSLHKALALEGLRDWYLRNTLGHAAAAGLKGQDAMLPRRRTTHPPHPHPLAQQAPPFQTEHLYSHGPGTQLPQSASFHGHPLHGRSLDLSLYQEPYSSQMQDLTLNEPGTDSPAPGTLV